MKKSTVILITVLLVAVAAVLAGCTSQTTPAGTATTQRPVAEPAQPAQPAQPVQPVATQAPNQDALFQSLVLESGNTLNVTMYKVADDGMNMDMAAMQKDAATLSSQAGTYYTKIQSLRVSPEFQEIQVNYLKVLKDVETGADLYMKGAVAVQAGDIDGGTKYISQGVTSFESANQYMNTMLSSVK
jgi:ABC-type oligopeptide transport system substrate-binding subunit